MYFDEDGVVKTQVVCEEEKSSDCKTKEQPPGSNLPLLAFPHLRCRGKPHSHGLCIRLEPMTDLIHKILVNQSNVVDTTLIKIMKTITPDHPMLPLHA